MKSKTVREKEEILLPLFANSTLIFAVFIYERVAFAPLGARLGSDLIRAYGASALCVTVGLHLLLLVALGMWYYMTIIKSNSNSIPLINYIEYCNMVLYRQYILLTL